MTWNTNWVSSEGKGKLLKVGLNNLRVALIERLDAINIDITLLLPEIQSKELITSSWLSLFEVYLNLCFSTNNVSFINHYNYATWEGNISELPIMSRAAILANLGESEILKPTDPLISASWMYQQYKIINQLRWSFSPTVTFISKQSRRGVSAISSADAINEYNIDTWSSENFGDTWNSTKSESGLGGGSWFVSNFRSKMQIPTHNTTLKPSVEFFMLSEDPIINVIYYSEDGYTKDKMYSKITMPEQTWDGNPIVSSNYVELTPNNFFGASGDTYSIIGNNRFFKTNPVLKWDGPNGFTYKDW